MSLKTSLVSLIRKGKRFTKVSGAVYRKILYMDSLSWSTVREISRITLNSVSCGVVSPINNVPQHIIKPYYCTEAVKRSDNPRIKCEQEVETMKRTCQLAKKMLLAAESFVKVGVSTDELDRYVHNLIIEHSAYPSPLLYYGFPKSICASVNNIACHGIPNDRKLQDGDIVTVDITVFRDGFHGDCAATFLVGNVDENGKELVSVAEIALSKAINCCGPGVPLRAIADTITYETNSRGFCVVPSICGHGIGRDFHECPEIIHSSFYWEDDSTVMLPGMTFTIEPVISEYDEEVILLDDGWSVASSSNSMCAQFEHTVLITETGVEVLTT